MSKIYLTEEQFKAYLSNMISESIFMEKDAGKFGADKLKKVTDYLANKAKNTEDGDDEGNIIRQARENGINIDSLRGNLSKADYNTEVNKRINELLKEKSEEINHWVKSALPTLRYMYLAKDADGNMVSTQNFSQGKEQVTRQRDAEGNLINRKSKGKVDDLPPSEREHILLVRDFLDKEGLTFIYRKANKPASVAMRYGVETKNADWTTPIEALNLDFSNISDNDIRDYYDGTRVGWINDELKKLGYITRTKDGLERKFKNTDPEWQGIDGQKGVADISRAGKIKQMTARYVKRTYGMDFNFGDGKSVFSFGNQKIDDRTVIVNFSAAMRCPAWNECLLKDACYARTTEKNYDNTFDRNLRTNLIWQQTENDETLTNLMLELIRSYIFNYRAAISAINKTESKRMKYTQESLSKMSMSQLQAECPEALEIVAETKRADTVRLNEDGDFIGQWLVDVWDAWAEDFKLAGVTVAAYTCRALNYEKVKNIILNVSQEGLVAGQNAPAVARFFYAVEPEEYDALGDTYGDGVDFRLDKSIDTITPVYRSLIDENGETKGYYYKCPCGRGKMTYEEYYGKDAKDAVPCTKEEFDGARIGSKKVVKFNGRVYKLFPNPDKSERVDCYRCRMCYGRNIGEIKTDTGELPMEGLPIYVLVSAHGANRDNFDKERRLAGRYAKEWIGLQRSGVAAREQQMVAEEIEPTEDGNSPMAINQIVKNTTMSVADHMATKGGLMEMRQQFNNILNKLYQP